jgi:O-Antigen ligase
VNPAGRVRRDNVDRPAGAPRDIRHRVLTGARLVLLAGPVAIAFFSGGYFDGPRASAGLVAWALVAVAALATDRPLPRAFPSRLALMGLTLLAIWTLVSFVWAPLAGEAYHAGQRVILYAGALVAATALLREERWLRAVEPAVAGGALVVVVYGLSERLAPWLVTLHHSATAYGRLEQPVAYWNGMGVLAALGIVLCARLAGTPSREDRLRALAAAATTPLGLGIYLTFSRGALFACLAGLITLVVAAPSRAQLRSIGLALAAGALSVLSAVPFSGVTSLSGSHGARVLQGSVTLVLLLAIASAAAVLQLSAARREREGLLATGGVKLPAHAPVVALLVVVGAFAAFLAVGATETRKQPRPSATAARYSTLRSDRYAYWRVAARAFRAEPVRGIGARGWAVYWLRYRPFAGGAKDAHSLYIQTAAELGLVGLVLLAMFLGGVAWAARDALRAGCELGVGPLAGAVVWVAHVALDWDWEIPAVTLPALVLAGVLLALADDLSGARARPTGLGAQAGRRTPEGAREGTPSGVSAPGGS